MWITGSKISVNLDFVKEIHMDDRFSDGEIAWLDLNHTIMILSPKTYRNVCDYIETRNHND